MTRQPTRAALTDLINTLIDSPMVFVVEGLQARPESSLQIAATLEHGVSASTIRTLRSGQHTGNLRVDVWSQLTRWLIDQEEVTTGL